MRLADPRQHPAVHAALTNVGISQHHMRPALVETSNTALLVPPLPGGPGIWDIAVPYDTLVVSFHFRSNRGVAEGGGKAGVYGLATRNQFHTTALSHGGDSTTAMTARNAWYSKVAAALNLSHKVFSLAGDALALTEAWLYATGPATRVLRTYWTNYSAALATLNCRAEIVVLG